MWGWASTTSTAKQYYRRNDLQGEVRRNQAEEKLTLVFYFQICQVVSHRVHHWANLQSQSSGCSYPPDGHSPDRCDHHPRQEPLHRRLRLIRENREQMHQKLLVFLQDSHIVENFLFFILELVMIIMYGIRSYATKQAYLSVGYACCAFIIMMFINRLVEAGLGIRAIIRGVLRGCEQQGPRD